MNRLTISLCLGFAALALAAPADAAISPQLAVCAVRHDPSTNYGAYGSVVVSLDTTHAGCDDGSYLQTTYFCSKQATSTSCTTSTAHHYSELAIQGIYQASVQALVNERFVEVFHDSGSSSKGQQLRVY